MRFIVAFFIFGTVYAIDPYPNAPPCPTHDPTRWHGVWDSELGCHYDHHHGVNPFETPFADRVAAWPSLFGNERHEGYIFLYDEPLSACDDFDGFGQGCVTRVLMRVHSTGTIAHLSVRSHSFHLIAEVSTNPPSGQRGIIETSGFHDFGITHCPYKVTHCPRPDDPYGDLIGDGNNLSGAEDQPPYRTSNPTSEKDRVLSSGVNVQFWNNLGPNAITIGYYPHVPNKLFQSAWKSIDSWGLVDPDDFGAQSPSENFLCPDFDCSFNHSQFCIFNVRLILPQQVQPGFTGFTDSWGHVNFDCISEGPECHPLHVSAGVPAGIVSFNLSRSVDNRCTYARLFDFDVYFGSNAAGWLRPAGHGTHIHSSPPPAGEDPPPSEDPPPPAGDQILTVDILSPSDGSLVNIGETFKVQAQVAASAAVRHVIFFLNGNIRCIDAVAPYSCDLAVYGTANSAHEISAYAVDLAGNDDVETISVKIDPKSIFNSLRGRFPGRLPQ